uniref:Uncharacterized protein n=1 Tax=Rangifer tarandus platyrhynchus TaxID=3082113 RepID=A0ACB0DYI8_RANTA|nr:unnamed protein product [Rangifer tarandus platyrhynchus]
MAGREDGRRGLWGDVTSPKGGGERDCSVGDMKAEYESQELPGFAPWLALCAKYLHDRGLICGCRVSIQPASGPGEVIPKVTSASPGQPGEESFHLCIPGTPSVGISLGGTNLFLTAVLPEQRTGLGPPRFAPFSQQAPGGPEGPWALCSDTLALRNGASPEGHNVTRLPHSVREAASRSPGADWASLAFLYSMSHVAPGPTGVIWGLCFLPLRMPLCEEALLPPPL